MYVVSVQEGFVGGCIHPIGKLKGCCYPLYLYGQGSTLHPPDTTQGDVKLKKVTPSLNLREI